jgi:hypothetical protein
MTVAARLRHAEVWGLGASRIVRQLPGKKDQTRSEDVSAASTAVYSLAAARLRKSRAKNAQTSKPAPPELTGLDLRAIDFERMTPSAREHFWFNVNRYARQLFGSSCERSMAESNNPTAPIAANHVRQSELDRVRRAQRVERSDLGMTFVLDALQILGAALCGAFATKPDLLGDAGMLPLAATLTATVAVFLAREVLATRVS